MAVRQAAVPAGDAPDVVGYLTGIPMSLRQSLKRPEEPSGRSFPGDFVLRSAVDLAALVPSRLPRFKAGDRPLAGTDWELGDLLGIGGFGEVWKARNHRLPGLPPVALKFCLDTKARKHLLTHEAKVIAAVQRRGRLPGIVPLLHSYLSNEPPCLEYEYVEGADLAGLVREWHAACSCTARWSISSAASALVR